VWHVQGVHCKLSIDYGIRRHTAEGHLLDEPVGEHEILWPLPCLAPCLALALAPSPELWPPLLPQPWPPSRT